MHRMNAIGKFISNFRDFYNEINAATLTGAIDVVVVEQSDGSFTCSPFHVRFGKLGVLRSREKVVDIEINGESLDIHMKLGESGEAFFVEEVAPGELGEDEFIPPHLACSPIPHDDAYLVNYPNHSPRDSLGASELHDRSFDKETCGTEEVSGFVLNELTEEQLYKWAPQKNEDASSQTYSYLKNIKNANDTSSQDLLQAIAKNTLENSGTLNNETIVSKDDSDIQLSLGRADDLSPQSVPKTFRAETLDDDPKASDKVRKISIANNGEFRPISLEREGVLDPALVQNPADNMSVTPFRDDNGSIDTNASASSILARKDSYKENALPMEGSVKAVGSNSGKRKKRRKSVMKKKTGQKKNNGGGGSSSQTEQSELSEAGSNVGKESLKDAIPSENMDELAVFQMDDVIQAKESDFVLQGTASRICSHLVGGIANTACEICESPLITITSADTVGSTTSADNLMELSRIQHASTETDFHFFSDTEITPGCTPPDSRPCSPVQSDTEFEMKRQSKAVGTEDDDGDKMIHGQLQQSWRWGELPSPPPRPQASRATLKLETAEPEPVQSSDEEVNKQQKEAAAAAEAAAQRSMLSGMFSFMKKTKRIRHNPEAEGIYLSDLNADEMDPEVVALYFPTSYRQGQGQGVHSGAEAPEALHDEEEDAESGNGTSLPQSPHSVEGAIGGPKSLDSDFEEPKHSTFEKKSYGEISMSLCGGLADSGPTEDTFLQNLVTYNDLVQDPKLIDNPNLVVRLNGKYLNWRTACPLVMSLVIFQKPLPQEVVESLSSEYMPLKKGQKKDVKQSGYTSWFSWRRVSEPKKLTSGHSEEEPSSPECDKSSELKEVLTTTPESPEVQEKPVPELQTVDSIEEELTVSIENDNQSACLKTGEMDMGTQTSLPGSPLVVSAQKDAKEEGYSGSNSSDESDEGHTKAQGVKLPMEKRSYYEHCEKYRKTLRLSSDQIASLNLREGCNEVVFSVTTAYQGTTRCKCHIYRWRFDDKVVISDIDGTITKSDVLGHILPIVGKDWAQSGVAQLFTKIKNNGYKLLYLSARAIGQARVTREYLRSIKQGDLSLPDGPLLLNPTSLISAFHREVIEKKPEEFKISCLRDIQALFPENSKPFYAGYGNRINDVWAYRAVGIPIFRIFTINHRGELKHELTQTFQSSYSNMSYIVDQMFPPPPEDTSEDFSNFIYWRDPIPDIVVDPLIISEVQVTTTTIKETQTKVIITGSAH